MSDNGGAGGEKWIHLRDRRWCELAVVVLDVVGGREGGVKGDAPGSELGYGRYCAPSRREEVVWLFILVFACHIVCSSLSLLCSSF